MLNDQSSFFSTSHETITRDFIGKLESGQEKWQPQNNNDEETAHVKKKSKKYNEDDWLELRLGSGTFPIVQQDKGANSQKRNKQSKEFDDLELRLGILIVPTIPSQQSDNQQVLDIDTISLIPAIGREVSINCLLRCPRSYYGWIALVNRSFRELIRSGELYKLRCKNDVIEHWVYISCRLMMWVAFNPYNKKWMNLPRVEADIAFQMGDKESLAVGTELLYLGYDMMGQAIYKYSLLTNSWSLGRRMNTQRCLFGSASLGQIGIFAGGVDDTIKVTNVVEKYNGDSGTWETLPSMLKPRRMSSGVFMDGKFYVIGGTGPDNKPWTCGEEFDLDSKKWTEVPNMAPVHNFPTTSAPPLVAVVDNELYAADWAEMALKKYAKNKKEWEIIGRLPETATNMHGWGIAFRGCGKRLIIVGGPRGCEQGYVEIYSWIPSQGPPQWTIIGQKESNNFIYNCAIMGC